MPSPLAREILKELTLPRKRRTFIDNGGVLPLMSDVHYFDCSGVRSAAAHLIARMAGGKDQAGVTFGRRFGATIETTGFLPAPKTWIECRWPGDLIIGYLLIEKGDHADVHVSVRQHDKWCSSANTFKVPLRGAVVYLTDNKNIEDMLYIVAFLAMINTPHIMGRRQIMPHAGLQHDIAKKFRGKGSFPLRAWTEIILQVSAPRPADSKCNEVRLNGARAMHFVRAYLRISFGKLQVVRSYWAGDAALGIKQSRYRIVEGQNHAG